MDNAIRDMGNMRALYNQVAAIFPEDARSNMEKLVAALMSSDLETARRAVHTLKGTAASIGALRLKAMAMATEEACKSGEILDAQKSIVPLTMELKSVNAALRAYLDSPAANGP